KATEFLMLGVGLLGAAGAARAEGSPTIEQVLSLKRALAPRLSPDGRYVAYEILITDWEADAFRSEIWLAAPAGGEPILIARSPKSNTAPRWSPDGKQLAFLSDRDGRRQVYRVDVRGGEARPVTRAETDVARAEWSPDGRRLAFTAADPEPPA